MRALLLCLLVACQQAKTAAGYFGGTAAEYIVCPLELESLFECGHVFECAATADTPSGLVEICVDDDDHPEHLDQVDALYGGCWPTPRHQGLCLVVCPPDTGRGGNAYSGTWCP